jgi:hypothetical protein
MPSEQKAFDHVNWTKLMQILKETGIECHEIRSISKLYMDQSVKSKTGPSGDKKWEDWQRS